MAYRRKKFFGKRTETGHVARTPSQLQEVYSDDDDGEGEDVEMWDQPEVKDSSYNNSNNSSSHNNDSGSPGPPTNAMPPRMSDSLYQETKAEAEASAGPQGAPGDLYSLIRTFPLFKMAPNAFVIAVSAKLRIQQVSPQEYIVTQGDEAKAMYWILKGQVNVTSRDGESVFAELEAGSFFGEIGILFDRPRTATVLASTKCVLAVLKGDSLNDILPKFPAMERAIRDEAQERLAIIEKTKIHLRNKPRMGGMVSPTTSIRNLLHEMPLFRHIPETIVHKLALAVEPRTYEPFQYIIKQDTIGQEIYFLTSGIVEVIDERHLGTAAHIIARLTKGSYFGEMAFLSSNPVRTASIRSISMVECLVLTTDTLESLCSQYPDIQQHIEQTASARIEQYERDPKQQTHNNTTNTQSAGGAGVDMTRRRSVADFSGKRNDSLFTVSRGGATFFSEPKDDHVTLPGAENTAAAAATKPPLTNNHPHSHTRRYSTGTVFEPVISRDGRIAFSNSWESNSGVSEGAPLSLGNYQMVQPRKCLSAGSSGTTSPSKRPALDNRDDEPLGKERREVSPRDPSSSPPIAAPLARSSSTGANNAKMVAPQRYSSFLLHPRLKKQKTFQRRKSSLFNVGPFSDAIQVRIFAYLDLPDLMVLQRVCQHWRQLLLTCPLNELDLKPYNRSIDDTSIVSIVNFVGARPKVVDISSCFHLTDDGFSYLVNGIGLAKIRVFKMTSVWEVSGMAIMDLTVPSIGADLEEIDLSNCRKVGDSTLARLVGWVQEEGPNGGDRETSPSSSVVGCPRLKRITISYCKHITDRSMHHMAVYAADRLEMLNLTRCTTITDHGFGYWNIRPFTRLKELVLADCTFLSDKAIISIVGAAKNLEFLDLSFCCALSDVSVEVLSLGCPSLKSLNLSFCGSAVSDANLRAVAMHLLDLEHLSVRGCVRVTAVGVDTVLAGCLKLKSLDITQCKNAGGWNQGDSKVVVKTT